METKTEHTPTPLSYDERERRIYYPSNKPVYKWPVLAENVDPETAAFIVRAVNSHEALLKHAIGRYSDISNVAEASRTEFEKSILKDLTRVIAQAEWR